MPHIDDCASKTDIELVGSALLDPDRFYCLAKRYEARLLRYIISITGFSREDAEDVLQETLVKTYFNLNGFDARLKFSSWIYRIAHNQAVSEIRRRAARPVVRVDDGLLERLAGGQDRLLGAESALDAAVIARAFEALNLKYREVLTLRFFEDKDYVEIADILRKPVSTVGNLIARGRKLFRAEYNKIISHRL